MSQALDLLRSLMTGQYGAAGPPTWPQVLGVFEQAAADTSDASGQVLSELAVFQGHITLDPSQGLPHAMPPTAMIRSLAVQILGQRSPKQYAAVLAKAAANKDSQILAEIATIFLVP